MSMEMAAVAAPTAGARATMAEPAGPQLVPEVARKIEEKPAVGSPPPLVRHTRRCNGRELCNCMLRVESALFHKNLAEKARKRRVSVGAESQLSAEAHRVDDEEKAAEQLEEKPHGDTTLRRTSARMASRARKLLEEEKALEAEQHIAKKQKGGKKKSQKNDASSKPRRAVKRYVPVTKLCEFDHSTKMYILSFLTPVELAMVGMTNNDWKAEAEMTAQWRTSEFVKLAATGDRPIFKYEKKDGELWFRYMHMHMKCVYKLFVFYTGYKTGQMRKDFAHWAFGVVEFDPNQPHLTILPNTWKFRGHEPWITLRNNGKHGEWHLRKQYKPDKASQRFIADVKDWAISLRPGSFLAIAYQNAGSTEPAWWEAQVWYVWRQEGQHKPAIAYDAETDTQYEVDPENLVEYFQRNPLHVIDVTTPKRRLCGACSSSEKSFKYCHIDKGHPML